ncbi:P83/100 family protein, partial [Treponema pallidum subsp. pallidum]
MKNVLPMCAVLGAGCLFALEVDRRELERANATVEFENFAGTHTDVDSAAAIRRIGEGLASALRGGVAGDRARYALIHAVGPHTTNGFDADILIIGAQAR